MANNWYISSGDYALVPTRQNSHVYSVGAIVRQAGSVPFGDERCFRAETVSGNSGASAPNWKLGYNQTTVDGGVTWREITGQEAYQSPGNWAAPAKSDICLTNSGAVQAGDNLFYSAQNHHELRNDGSETEHHFPGSWVNPCRMFSVDSSASGHVPPTDADLMFGATMENTGAKLGLYQGDARSTFIMHGFRYKSDHQIQFGGYINRAVAKNCLFESTSASADPLFIQFGGTDCGAYLEDCTFKFADAAHHIWFEGGLVNIKGGGLDPASAAVDFFFHLDAGGLLEMQDFDFRGKIAADGACIRQGSWGHGLVINCPKDANTTWVNYGYEGDSQSGPDGWTFVQVGPDSMKFYQHGHQQPDANVVPPSGADKSSRIDVWAGEFAYKATIDNPFRSLPMGDYNDGVDATYTVHLLCDAAAAPTNAQICMEAQYNGGTKTTGKANFLAADVACASDADAAWSAPARTNSTDYAEGDVFSVGTKVFSVVEGGGGTTAASEPSGYASVAEGATISDGSVTARACRRFKIAVTLSSPTPSPGPVRLALNLDANSGWRVWIDPKIETS